MVQRFKIIVFFYKQFVLVSLLINLLLVLLKFDWFPALTSKIVFVGLFAWAILGSERKQQLNFYRNLQLSPTRLFLGVLVLDLLLFALIYFPGLWFLK